MTDNTSVIDHIAQTGYEFKSFSQTCGTVMDIFGRDISVVRSYYHIVTMYIYQVCNI